ncbi:cytochrome P450 [Nocardia salmonicida]|uniref:cytochrome P450 n=1 Tax=Nocardia salmonicida TaxID=53431 RepID=UPI00366B6232
MAQVRVSDDDLADLIPLHDPAFYARDIDDVHAALAEVRNARPVLWHEQGQYWVLSRHADQRAVGSNPEVFSSRFGFQIGDSFPVSQVIGNLPTWAQDQLDDDSLTRAEQRAIIARSKVSIGDPEIESVIVVDPPRHRALRNVMTNGLTPKIVNGMEPRIVEIVDDALDSAEQGGALEFIDVARRVPLMVIAGLVGVPESDAEVFVDYANAFMATVMLNERDPEKMARNQRMAGEFSGYIEELIRQRRAKPGEDLISRMLATQLDGEPVAEKVVMMLVRSLISGGTDTTKHLLSWSVYNLGTRPEQRRILSEKPELMANAINEITRWTPIVWSNARTAVQDTVIGDRTIKAGDFVVLVFPSANRDEEVWERPFEFDVTRKFRVQPIAFGWGEHLCPGNPLARLEGRIMLERLFARCDDFEVVGEPDRLMSSFINGLNSLRIQLH